MINIVWILVGGVIFALGYMSVAQAVTAQPTSLTFGPELIYIGSQLYLVGAIVLMIAGTFIIAFGITATQLKVQADITADEVEKRLNTMAIITAIKDRLNADAKKPPPPSD